MAQTRAYHGFDLAIAKNSSDKVCYILLPEGLKSDGLEWMEQAAEEFGCNIIAISGMNWNDDLTPWQAKGVFKKEKDFGGKASFFLKDFMDDYLVNVESSIGVSRAERTLVGISLSGLFAIWSSTQTDRFRGIASISGSLWYDGFAQRFNMLKVNPAVRKIFLSLGDKEKNSKDQRMATVEDATSEVVSRLKSQGIPVDFVKDEGTHFSPIIPRLQAALTSLYTTPTIKQDC